MKSRVMWKQKPWLLWRLSWFQYLRTLSRVRRSHFVCLPEKVIYEGNRGEVLFFASLTFDEGFFWGGGRAAPLTFGKMTQLMLFHALF